MKAQVVEPEEVVEFVPQILNLKKILVPIDFSDMSKQAFQYALRFAEQFRCEIVLLHVVEPETVIAGTPLAVDVFSLCRARKGARLCLRRTRMKAEIEIEPAIEPMRTRVALHPFLAGMNRSQVALLTDCAMAVHFEKGQIIFREGEMANRFYLIETGKIVLESSNGQANPVIIDTIGAGELLGWSWMFPPYTWRMTARAVEPTSAIFFYGTILREYCERDCSVGYELFKRMAPVMIKRMQAARRKMLGIQSGLEVLKPSPVVNLSEYD